MGDPLRLTVKTEKENDGHHGIWFNRGAIASQAYARQFGNHKPTRKEMNDPKDKHTKWLSRGLLEACLEYIDSTKQSEALRGCVYEFTYAPIIKAFKAKVDDGFDVKLIVHDDNKGANRKAIKGAGLDLTRNGQRIVIWRTRPPIPHNKFIIKFDHDKPQQVWTGSTNITPSGFLGQSNVGHLIDDSDLAEQYFKYWTLLSGNPTGVPAKAGVATISPYPARAGSPNSKTCIFSPRADGVDAELVRRPDERCRPRRSCSPPRSRLPRISSSRSAVIAISSVSFSRKSRRPRPSRRRSGATAIS